MLDTFVYPWRIETRESLFHPWRTAVCVKTLEAACNHPGYDIKRTRFVRVRAN